MRSPLLPLHSPPASLFNPLFLLRHLSPSPSPNPSIRPPLVRLPKPITSPSYYSSMPHSTAAAAADAHYPLMECRCSSGEIHVILGPMFAGKTTALLRRVQMEVSKGRSVAIIKSDKDTRYEVDSVVTHDGKTMPCLPLSELSALQEKLGSEAYRELDVIGIDEAQFFEDLYDFCCNAADRDGKIVILAGLDGDYLRRRFGSVLDVVPLADTVTKLTARCELCGRRAFFTMRKTSDTKTELIGGADVYMPVCRQHYVDGQLVVEATKIVLNVERSTMVGELEPLPS